MAKERHWNTELGTANPYKHQPDLFNPEALIGGVQNEWLGHRLEQWGGRTRPEEP